MDPRIQSLLDKQEIHEQLMRYLRGVDRLDSDLIGRVFHEGAILENGNWVTGAVSPQDIVARAAQLFSGSTMHFVGNELIQVDGDRATSECYFLALGEQADENAFKWRGGRYLDEWERREDSWKITRRRILSEWDRVEPIAERWGNAAHFARGLRSKDDLSYSVMDP